MRASGALPRPTDRRKLTWSTDHVIRVFGVAAAVAYAVALASRGAFGMTLGSLVVADTAAALTLWRLERQHRSSRARLLENAGYLVVFAAVLTTTIIAAPAWATRFGSWQWYPVAVAAACSLIWLSGMRLRPLLTGELAFLAGQKPKAHAVVGSLNMTTGAVAEEVMFRSVALTGSGPGVIAVSLLGSAVFVVRHHLPGWAAQRASARTFLTETSSAAVFLALTVWSHSIYPALTAHVLTNAPGVVMQVQRAWQRQET